MVLYLVYKEKLKICNVWSIINFDITSFLRNKNIEMKECNMLLLRFN